MYLWGLGDWGGWSIWGCFYFIFGVGDWMLFADIVKSYNYNL